MGRSMSNRISEIEMVQKRNVWVFTILISLVGGILFLRPYMAVIVLAMLMSYLFFPIYKKMLKITKGKKKTSVTIATILHVLIVAVPIILIIYYAIVQGLNFVDSLGLDEITFGEGGTIDNTVVEVVDKINEYIENLTGAGAVISEEGVVSFFQTTLPNFLKTALNSIINLISGIPGFFMYFIIYLFVFTGLTLGHETFIQKVKDLSPFDKSVNEVYFNKMGAMATGMVKGQFIIAFLQAVLGSLSLIPLIGSNYFWFFLILFTFLNMIPLGSGLLLIPVGILAVLFGNVADGLIILGTHFLITTNIDNILRPMLVPKAAYMPAAFTMLSAFAGVFYWGFLGVIYGPIVMILILTTIDAYIDQKKTNEKKLAKKTA